MILYNEADYNDEFKELIQKQKNKDNIKTKRLIIKKYQISNKSISFDKKIYNISKNDLFFLELKIQWLN